MEDSGWINKENQINFLAREVVGLLKEQKRILTTIESCTGGWLSKSIVDISGCSEVFHQGIVTYSNQAKQKYVGVESETLDQFGAVSKETASQMALGGVENTDGTIAISITGIAGPDGGTPEKPVGLVYVGVSFDGSVETKKLELLGNREEIREQAVIHALEFLKAVLLRMKERL